jgi:hypothetical protein
MMMPPAWPAPGSVEEVVAEIVPPLRTISLVINCALPPRPSPFVLLDIVAPVPRVIRGEISKITPPAPIPLALVSAVNDAPLSRLTA